MECTERLSVLCIEALRGAENAEKVDVCASREMKSRFFGQQQASE